MQFGIFCLVPIVVIIVLCIVTKHGIASLMLGTVISYIMLNGINFFEPMMNGVYVSLANDDDLYMMLCLYLRYCQQKGKHGMLLRR